MNEYSLDVLRMVVGHCSQNIGWNGIQASSLDLLTEVLQKYLMEIAKMTHRYSEQFGRTEPNLDDIGFTFKEMGITIQDLSDFTSNVEPIPFPNAIPKLPIPTDHHLNFLKPGSNEILSRPVHVFEHLPPMHQIVTDEELIQEDGTSENEPLPMNVDSVELTPGSNGSNNRSGVFKRPDYGERKKGARLEEDGQPWREITSVMMTTGGFLSSSREGKLPEARIDPSFMEVEPDVVVAEKKISMKKIIEGIKKTEEPVPLKEEKETTVTENESGPEKETKTKSKKKRVKAKVMEEFAFFDKESPPPSKTVLPEPKPPSDPTKQKLNIFRKIHKIKEPDSPTHPAVGSRPSEVVHNEPSVSGIHRETANTVAEPLHTEAVSPIIGKQKISKKEQKAKAFADSMEVDESKSFSAKHAKMITSQNKSPAVSVPEEMEQEKRRNPSKEKTDNEKLPMGKDDFVGSAKKKRGRPTKMPSSPDIPESSYARPIPEAVGPQSVPAAPPSAKPFFPFPSPFAVPGLIPPPLFQNVPLNLLGLPLGMSPLAAPGHRAPIPTPPLPMPPSASPLPPPPLMPRTPSPSLFTPPRSEMNQKLPSPPKKSSPNIVDSLPEAVRAPMDGPAPTGIYQEGASSKKEKREKKVKEKKKKDKKLKSNEKHEEDRKGKKEKKKVKREKSREKEEAIASTVPKITFKFGAAPSSPRPPTPDSTPKLVFKAMPDREVVPSTSSGFRETSSPPPTAVPSVDVAKFSALVTRPPKTVKTTKKEAAIEKFVHPAERVASPIVEPSPSQGTLSTVPRSPSPSVGIKVHREKPHKPPKVTKDKEKEKEKKKLDKPGEVAVITETVGSYYDEFGNKIWICPACGRQDDGTPMIGCDECDDWYHWVCVGIRVPPAETESWFCQRCVAKKQGPQLDKKGKIRKKKPA